jgi:hypothetical protein
MILLFNNLKIGVTMKNIHYLSYLCLILFLIGCGSKSGPDLSPEASRKTLKNVPSWYLDNPIKEGFIYEAADGTSQSMQLAVDKARVAAVTNLSQMIKSEWSGYTKRVQEETGLSSESKLLDQFSTTSENTISNQLENVKVVKREIQVENSNGMKIYHAFVLVEFDEHAAAARLLSRIKADQAIYEAIRAAELVEEMEQKVEAYRQRYK